MAPEGVRNPVGSKASSEVHSLAAFVHGSLVALHLLGTVYSVRRKNWFDLLVHSCGVAFSVRATAHHAKLARPTEVKVP